MAQIAISPRSSTADQLQEFLSGLLGEFPWELVVTDWTGAGYSIGRKQPHWRGEALQIDVKTEAAGRDLLALNPLGFLDRFVNEQADLSGNLYLLAAIRDHANLKLPFWRMVLRVLSNRGLLFQSARRAASNVRSHYDIPQEALNLYLDKTYLSYSCGMFEHPESLDVSALVTAGHGRADRFDSLEKAQWRKFKDAADYVAPSEGETVLDVGCGYGGQLEVLLECYPGAKAVGWTHSHNQVQVGREKLSALVGQAAWEIHEGDYRNEARVFDHVTSTGMISHVGPRGLVPYVREVRRRVKKGGRYLHHALMTPYRKGFFDAAIGVAFNKKYVWPGFHWFTVGQHVQALEENGFRVVRLVDLSLHYGKTTVAWYERLMANAGTMRELAGEGTLRAWRVYLACSSTGFRQGTSQVYRIYCKAV